ncbi:hypothetical protein D3C72_861320 [compost metagenome]
MREGNGIDARHFTQWEDNILIFHIRPRFAVEAGMSHSDDDIGARFSHLRNKLLSRSYNIFSDDLAFEIGFVPFCDLGGDKAEYTDLNGLILTSLIFISLGENFVRLEAVDVIIRVVVFIIFVDVRVDIREACLLHHLIQEVQTIVEFVVTECGHIIAHQVHGFIDSMSLIRLNRVHKSFICTQGCTLN